MENIRTNDKIHTIIDITMAETDLDLYDGVMYLLTPIIPRINPTIGIRKANSIAQLAVLLDSCTAL